MKPSQTRDLKGRGPLGRVVNVLKDSSLFLKLPRGPIRTSAPSRDRNRERGRSHRLLAHSGGAGRFGGRSNHSPSSAPARRLGIVLWQTHSWTKPLTTIASQTHSATCLQKR